MALLAVLVTVVIHFAFFGPPPLVFAIAGDNGDYNDSGAIDMYDFTALVSHFSQTNCTYNLTGTCKIDTTDISLLASHFGNLIGSGGSTADVAKWHPYTISFTGPQLSESDNPSPFLNYRLNVTFTSPSDNTYLVPGFFAADGNAATTHATAGKIWQVRFSPDEAGVWHYSASFRTGPDVAVSTSPTAGSPTSFNGQTGMFTVGPLDSSAPGFLKYGRLEYVNKHYLKFRDGPYFIKGGTDSPENFLGYDGFDNTYDPSGSFVHQYANHKNQWQAGDPDWGGGKGKGIIGTLNYLADQHVNSIYFLPMNLGGDGNETFPFVSPDPTNDAKSRYDVSKLEQWRIVFEHAQRQGIQLHVVLSESESANENWLPGRSEFSNLRKLYYRELIARFGYIHALQWNIGEEANYPENLIKDFAGYIQDLDPFNHPITFHTWHNRVDKYDSFYGDDRIESTSLQFHPNNASRYAQQIFNQSQAANHPLIVGLDEPNFGPGGLTPDNTEQMRKLVLYATLFSGGQIEWYIAERDQNLEDFNPYHNMWEDMWYARKFMQDNLPFWDMIPKDSLISNADDSSSHGGAQAMYHPDCTHFAVYLPNAGAQHDSIDLSDANCSSKQFEFRWYNPRTGAFEGNSRTISGGGQIEFGDPPSNPDTDWVILIKLQ